MSGSFLRATGAFINRTILSLFVVSSLSLSATLSAQSNSPPPPPPDTARTELSTVVVTAARAASTALTLPLSVSVISRSQLAAAPEQTLDQVLRSVPGMNLAGAPFYATDPTGQQTKLRGVTNSKVLVLLDGIPVHDPFYSTTQWYKVPLSAIERVEVVQGGGSSLWGNMAVAGVVNIISRKPINNAGEMDVSYQSFGTVNAALGRNFLLSNGLALRVSGNVMRTGGYQTTPAAYLDRVPGKGASSARTGNVQVAAYYEPGGSYTAFARVGYHQSNEDIGNYQYGNNIQKSPDAALGFTKRLSQHVRSDTRAWAQYNSFDKANGAACYLESASVCNNTSTTAQLVHYANSRDDNPYRELGASTVFSFDALHRLVPSIQLGADFRSVSGEDHATTYNKPTGTDVASASINRTNYGEGAQRFIALFSQVRLNPLPRVEATASVRYDGWENTGGVARMTMYKNGVPQTPLGGPIANSSTASFNPSLGLRVSVNNALSLRAAAYKGFRAPGLNNLYRTYSSTTLISIANPNLSPEVLKGVEGGANFTAGSLFVGATYFNYQINSLIATYRINSAQSAPAAVTAICGPTLSNCPATVNYNTNNQDGRSHGVETSLRWQPAATLTLNSGYAYTRSYYTSSTTSDPIGVQLGAVPPHVATAGFTWQATRKWSINGGARYSSDMYLDVNRTIPQAAFTLFDASTSWHATPSVDVYGAITNIGNVRYSDTGTTSAASTTLALGRSLTSGLRVRF